MAVVNGISMPYVIYIYKCDVCVCTDVCLFTFICFRLFTSEKKTGFQEPSSNVFFNRPLGFPL